MVVASVRAPLVIAHARVQRHVGRSRPGLPPLVSSLSSFRRAGPLAAIDLRAELHLGRGGRGGGRRMQRLWQGKWPFARGALRAGGSGGSRGSHQRTRRGWRPATPASALAAAWVAAAISPARGDLGGARQRRGRWCGGWCGGSGRPRVAGWLRLSGCMAAAGTRRCEDASLHSPAHPREPS